LHECGSGVERLDELLGERGFTRAGSTGDPNHDSSVRMDSRGNDVRDLVHRPESTHGSSVVLRPAMKP
jgi:hypothetical protein